MNMHDERYVLSIATGHRAVRLRDQQTGETHEFSGTRALYDALGVLAEWRERDVAGRCNSPHPTLNHAPHDGCPGVGPLRATDAKAGYGVPGCNCPLPEKMSESCPIHGTAHNAHYGVPGDGE